VEIQNQRAHRRYDCRFPVQVRSEGGTAHGALTDIGRGGCRVEMDSHQGEGVLGIERLASRVHLDVTYPWGDGALGLDAVLRHTSTDGERLVCGVEFGRLTDAQDAGLSEFIMEVGSFP